MLYEWYTQLNAFFAAGGPLLNAIFVTCMVMWGLLLERFFYVFFQFPLEQKRVFAAWNEREDRHSWYAHAVRRRMISQLRINLSRNVNIIRALVAVCPFLGILGTVTGMVIVFDTMALTGTGNARGMASGISMATLPTMAGLVVAISGLFFLSRLDSLVNKRTETVEDELIYK